MHGLMMDAPLTITEIMKFGERNYPDAEIVSVTLDNPRHRCTLRDVFRRARQLANALTAAGIKPGDRIGTLAWNDYRHYELYYAVSCMGAVLHTINPRLFPEQLEYIINHAEDRLLFIDPTLLPVLAQLQGKMPLRRAGRRADERRGHARAGEGQAASPTSRSSRASPTPSTGRTSTSVPRARSATRRAPRATRRACSTATARPCCTRTRAAWPTRSASPAGTVVLAVVPMFHANAWGLPYNAPMVGSKLVFPGPKMGDAATLVALMNEEGVTMAAGVPTVWTLLLNYLDQSGAKLTTLTAHAGRRLRGAAADDPRLRPEARRARCCRAGA